MAGCGAIVVVYNCDSAGTTLVMVSGVFTSSKNEHVFLVGYCSHIMALHSS